jgi:hypothetical protein
MWAMGMTRNSDFDKKGGKKKTNLSGVPFTELFHLCLFNAPVFQQHFFFLLPQTLLLFSLHINTYLSDACSFCFHEDSCSSA